MFEGLVNWLVGLCGLDGWNGFVLEVCMYVYILVSEVWEFCTVVAFKGIELD